MSERPDLDAIEAQATKARDAGSRYSHPDVLPLVRYAHRLEAELAARDPLAMSQRINELLEDRRRLEADRDMAMALAEKRDQRAEAAERERDRLKAELEESLTELVEAERERDEARAQVKSIAKQLAWSRDDAGAIECQRDEERELRRRALMRALFYRRALREAKAMRTAIGWTVDRAIDEREKAEAEAARLREVIRSFPGAPYNPAEEGREQSGPNAKTGMSKFAQRGEQTLTFGMGIVGNPTVPPDEELRLGPNVDREALEKAPNVIPEGYFERHPLKELRDGKWVEVKKDEGGGAGGER